MHIILMGEKETKRTLYFEKAAKTLNQTIRFIPLSLEGIEQVKQLSQLHPGEIVIKIDPISHKDSEVDRLPDMIENYKNLLMSLQAIPNISFLNKPSAILETLNKVVCKQRLMEKGVMVTPFYHVEVKDIDELRAFVKEKKVYQIFIKANYGSGAAGVVAYRWHPIKNEERIYTALRYEEGKIYNTKCLRAISDKKEIEQILNVLLKQEVIIERWVPKASYKGLTYDLRVVWQFGKIEIIVVRQSEGPITNLHLNNRALDIEELGLTSHQMAQIERICNEAMVLFPGLNVAGIDLLISPDQKQVRIIEINGQGDLIYADLFKENQIYRHQIERMIL